MTDKVISGSKQVFTSEKNATNACLEGVKCFDCDCLINIKDDEIENGALLAYSENGEDMFVFKCDSCHQEKEGLDNYRECEVYTRIVGYLRPVKQYNPGKQQEYIERKEYKVTE